MEHDMTDREDEIVRTSAQTVTRNETEIVTGARKSLAYVGVTPRSVLGDLVFHALMAGVRASDNPDASANEPGDRAIRSIETYGARRRNTWRQEPLQQGLPGWRAIMAHL